jgi:diguanylate cyclase (GGDEF)-like protein/PAS domain S-box-containing protein
MGDTGWQRIVRLVTRVLAVRAAAIAMAEGDRLVVVAHEGFPLDSMPRCGSLPGRTLDAGAQVVVRDLAALDPPVPVPAIDGRPLRFYAGVPIRGPDGGLVGTLCAADVVPRILSPDDLALFESLAALVGDQLLLEHERASQARLAAALRASEERFQDFAETASDWFWEMDAELRFSWLSDSVRELFGLDPAWHYGKTRLEIAATPADREIAERIQELMLRREPFRDVEYCRRSPAGDHWLRISGKPFFSADGTFLGYRGTGRDVTELVRQREAARAAEERYRRLVEVAPVGLFVHREGRIVLANGAAAAILGAASPEDLIGCPALQLVAPADRARIAGRARRLLERGGTTPPIEITMTRLDGTPVEVETAGVAIADGDARAIQVVLRDVSERKAAERALREAEARYRALVELSPDPIVMVEDGRFVFANCPAAELFGMRAPAELIGRSLFDFFPEAQHERIRRRHATPLREGESLPPIELEILRPDGTRVEIEAKSSLVLHEGKRRLLGVLRDIGARKAAERALREAEERWRTLVEVAPVGILVYGEGRYRYANRAAAEILGAPDPSGLVGVDPFELITEPYRAAIRERADRVLATGLTAPPVEIEMRRLDGRVVTVETVTAAIHVRGARALQIVMRDVSERKAAERALVEAEERWRSLVELSPEAVLLIRDGRYVFANRRAAELFGAAEPTDLVGRLRDEFFPEPHRSIVAERGERLLRERGRLEPIEVQLRRLDGRVIDVESSGTFVLDGGRPAIQTVLRDITERKAAERALVEAEERWRTLVEVAPIGFLLYRDGCYRYANPAAARILGARSPDELVGLDPFTLILEPYHATIRARAARLLAGGSNDPPLEIEMRRLDGGTAVIATRGAAIRVGGRPAIQVLIEDVSERKRLEAELRRLAYHDALTGLPNRALFFDRLAQAVELAEREGRLGALLLLDLDGFKQVNDGLGHDAGDALLRGVARRLRRVIRRSDTVARLAGDEFALLLYPIRDPATVERVAERIRAVLDLPVRHRGRVLRAKTSVGAALFPTDGTNIDTLFKHADLALYRAKAEGRGGLAMVDDAMRLAFARRIRLGEELREAVEAGTFEVLHEPRVALEDDRPVAVEAVPFWSPVGAEPIFGAALLDLANECGVAAKLALETLGRARDPSLARDRTGLPPLAVAVDVPVGLLTTEGGAARILRHLQDRGLAPQRLVLELDEAAFADRDRGPVLDAAARLREAGVRLILDRFGLGACSLRPLLERRVDGVNFSAEPRDAPGETTETEALAASLIELATRFGMQVTALGVATEEARRTFAALGCHAGQGPLWSGPLAAEALVELLGRAAPGPCACALSGAPWQPRPPLTGRLPDP